MALSRSRGANLKGPDHATTQNPARLRRNPCRLSLASPAAADESAPVPVVATFSIIGDMAARIGGAHVSVTTLVGPDGAAHVYQPTPAAARAVSEADVLIVNGLDFEGWLDRLIDASDFEGARVVATKGIEPLAFEDLSLIHI